MTTVSASALACCEKTLWQNVVHYSTKYKYYFTMQIMNYKRAEFSTLVFPFNIQCMKATSWSELKSCFIAYFTVCIYAMIVPDLIIVNLPSCCPMHTDIRNWSANKGQHYFPHHKYSYFFTNRWQDPDRHINVNHLLVHMINCFNRRQEGREIWILNYM